MKYLLNFLHYDTNLQQYIDHKKGPRQIFPLCCMPNCVGGKSFMIRCKHGILQYVIIRPLTTLIAFTSQLFNFYGEGNYNPFSGYTFPVLLLINNASQVLAMYCLVIFYTGYQQELKPMRPLAKFFSIKLVVFFSFFQSVVISGLLEWDLVENTFRQLFPDLDDKVSLGRKAQELLICFDMLIAAIGLLFAFPHKPFVDEVYESTQDLYEQEVASAGCCHAMRNLFDFSDERSDINEHFTHIFDRFARLFKRTPSLPAIVSDSAGESNTALQVDYDDPSVNGHSQAATSVIGPGRNRSSSHGSTTNYHSCD